MTLSEVLLVVAASSVTTWIVTSIMTSIADPAQRREMGVRLQGDTEDLDKDNGYTKPDIDADEF